MSVHHFFSNSSKIPAKGSTQWLELITKILNFLQIFTVTKSTTQLCNISENLQESHQKNYISDNSCGYLHSLFLPGSNKCFFYMFSTIHPYLSALFPHVVFFFHLFFFLILFATFCNLQCLIRFHYNLPVISRR